VLLSLWSWLEEQGPAVRDAGQQALGELGVQAIPAPEGDADPRFDREGVYRLRDAASQQVMRPAVVLLRGGEAHNLRPGIVRIATKARPPADEFMRQELAALLTDMGRWSGTWCRLDQLGEKEVEADKLKVPLERWIKRWVDAAGTTGQRRRADAFGNFFQEVLRVGPLPPDILPSWWKTRQEEFRKAAEHYFNEHRLEVVLMEPGQPASKVKQDYCYHISLRSKVPGYQPGQVVEVRAPVLRLGEGDSGILKGTLYFNPT
jgi:hypothetical protein